MHERRHLIWLAALAVGVAAAVFVFVPPIAQPPWYHDFADRRSLLVVPNFFDVASNLPFVAVGVAGLARLPRQAFIESREHWPYAVFFGGLVFTGCASAWYHLAPTDARLAWDRLGMSVAFAGFAAAALAERVSVKSGLVALAVLLLAGPAAVGWWVASEAAGAGDLRAWGLLQLAVMLLLPLLLWLTPARVSRGGDWLAVLALYALALALEWLDREVFDLTGSVSGHTLKHVVAALAGYAVLRHLRRRRMRPAGPAASRRRKP